MNGPCRFCRGLDQKGGPAKFPRRRNSWPRGRAQDMPAVGMRRARCLMARCLMLLLSYIILYLDGLSSKERNALDTLGTFDALDTHFDALMRLIHVMHLIHLGFDTFDALDTHLMHLMHLIHT